LNVGAHVNNLGVFHAPPTYNVTATGVTLNGGTLIAGDLIDDKGTWAINTGATFQYGTGTVAFTSGAAQSIIGTGIASFNNLTVNKSAGTLTQSTTPTTLNIFGDFTQTLGGFTPIAAGTLNVGGDWIYTAGTFTPGTGT